MNKQLKLRRDEQLKYYIDLNGFQSALRTRPDKGAIYTNEIIHGWIEDTYAVAYKDAIQAVIELIGEFDKDKAIEIAKHEDSDGYFGFLTGSEWQHQQILNKLKWDEE